MLCLRSAFEEVWKETGQKHSSENAPADDRLRPRSGAFVDPIHGWNALVEFCAMRSNEHQFKVKSCRRRGVCWVYLARHRLFPIHRLLQAARSVLNCKATESDLCESTSVSYQLRREYGQQKVSYCVIFRGFQRSAKLSGAYVRKLRTRNRFGRRLKVSCNVERNHC